MCVVPLLGILLLPWTTLTYLVVAPGGVTGRDIVFLGLAVVLDLASYGGAALSNSRRTRETVY
jgi:predicted methyltransferase MtxX (methanogen marker protein 4)